MQDLLFVILGIVIAIGAIWSRTRYADFLAQRPEDYAGAPQDFDISTHLNGPIDCEGIIYGPLGRVTSRFVARFDCHWDGNTGRMDEAFEYSDGSTQHRTWHLTLGAGGAVTATADDIDGTAHGKPDGDAFCMRYRFRLPKSAGGHVMDVVDWMYLAPNGAIVNRSQFRKFGIKMAELVATMRPAAVQVQKAA